MPNSTDGPATCTRECDPDGVRLRFAGCILTGRELKQMLGSQFELLGGAESAVVLDFSGVGHMGGTCLGEIVAFRKRLNAANRDLILQRRIGWLAAGRYGREER